MPIYANNLYTMCCIATREAEACIITLLTIPVQSVEEILIVKCLSM